MKKNRTALKMAFLACVLSLAAASGATQVYEPFAQEGLPSVTSDAFSASPTGRQGSMLRGLIDTDEEDNIGGNNTNDENLTATGVATRGGAGILAILAVCYGLFDRWRLGRKALRS